MKRTFALIAGATLLSAASLVGQTPAAPDSVIMDRAPLGAVTFVHVTHQEMAECTTCHHESRPEKPATSPYQPCDACHAPSAQAPMTTNLRDAFHDMRGQSGICIDCHKEESSGNGDTVPVRCPACHVRGGR